MCPQNPLCCWFNGVWKVLYINPFHACNCPLRGEVFRWALMIFNLCTDIHVQHEPPLYITSIWLSVILLRLFSFGHQLQALWVSWRTNADTRGCRPSFPATLGTWPSMSWSKNLITWLQTEINGFRPADSLGLLAISPSYGWHSATWQPRFGSDLAVSFMFLCSWVAAIVHCSASSVHNVSCVFSLSTTDSARKVHSKSKNAYFSLLCFLSIENFLCASCQF